MCRPQLQLQLCLPIQFQNIAWKPKLQPNYGNYGKSSCQAGNGAEVTVMLCQTDALSYFCILSKAII